MAIYQLSTSHEGRSKEGTDTLLNLLQRVLNKCSWALPTRQPEDLASQLKPLRLPVCYGGD